MFPQMGSALLGWGIPVQMKIISKQPVDFELQEDVVAVPTLEMMLQAMSPQKVDRKPENERTWKWWDGWSIKRVPLDSVMQDPDGKEFRVSSVRDWSQAGFFAYELVEQPKGQ